MILKTILSSRTINLLRSTSVNKLSEDLKKQIYGFHIINNSPIIGLTWERINYNIFKNSDIEIHEITNGNHVSGIDLKTCIGDFSNKTCKEYTLNKNNYLKLSSYRLSSLCNNKNLGDINKILYEIKKRNDSFNYYSVLSRKEYFLEDKFILNYKWYLIPKDYYYLDPYNYDWSYNIKKETCPITLKDNIIGYKTNNLDDGNSMNISFSMSSQLWMTINTDGLGDYLISDLDIIPDSIYNRNIDYSDISERLI